MGIGGLEEEAMEEWGEWEWVGEAVEVIGKGLGLDVC